MNLLYVTRVDINSKAAQSLQIRKMSESFFETCNSFRLIYQVSGSKYVIQQYAKPIFLNFKNKYIRNVLFYFMALSDIRKVNYDVVFTRDIAVVLLCVILRKNCTYEVHHDFEGFLGKFIFYLCKNSRYLKLVFISEGANTGFHKRYNIKSDWIVCHDGYDPKIFEDNMFHDKEFEDFQQQNKKILVHCGGFSIFKGAEKISQIVTKNPHLGVVQIGGVTGPIKGRKLLDELRDEKNFYYIEHIDNSKIGYYLKKASILFFPMDVDNPYWWCTSPLKLVEYVASGKPILGSFVGSSRELIYENQVVEFEPSNSQEMLSKLDYLISVLPEFGMKSDKSSRDCRIITWDERAKRILKFMYDSM